MGKSNRSKDEMHRRNCRAKAIVKEGMPAKYLPSARAFMRDAPMIAQNGVLSVLRYKTLEEIWSAMETPDFFTKHTVLVLCLHGWNPYALNQTNNSSGCNGSGNNNADTGDVGLVRRKIKDRSNVR